MNKRESRLLEAIQWTKVPLSYALRLARRPGPFKRVRRIPLVVLCKLVEAQAILMV